MTEISCQTKLWETKRYENNREEQGKKQIETVIKLKQMLLANVYYSVPIFFISPTKTSPSHHKLNLFL